MPKKLTVLAALIALLGLSLTACGDNTNSSAAPAAEETCFTQPDAQQREELEEYLEDQPTTQRVDTDGQAVCVLEADGNGGYQQHYYQEEDHFSDYLLYSMLLGNSNTLATVGLLTGDLDPGQAMALAMLASVGSDGHVSRPYAHGSNGWERKPSKLASAVKTVRYGSKASTAYKSGLKPPAGYRTTVMPVVKTDVAQVSKSSTGKLTVTKTAPPAGWKPAYKNPSKAGGSGSSTTKSNKGTGGSTTNKQPSKPAPPRFKSK